MNPNKLFDLTLDQITALPSVPLLDRDQLPNAPGIYFALSGTNELYYIGRSRNMRVRWLQHHRYSELCQVSDIRLAFAVVEEQHMLGNLERALIRRLNPPINDIFTARYPQPTEIEALFSDSKVLAYLENPGGAMPIALKDAIKLFAEPVCAYCGSEDFDARKIRLEIFDTELFSRTRDFAYTGVTCNSCGVVRGGGTPQNTAAMRQALYVRLTRSLDRVLSFCEPFGINCIAISNLRDIVSPQSFRFYNQVANDTHESKKS